MNATINKYWFNHMTIGEQLEFQRWALEVNAALPAIRMARDFYCDSCGWRGELHDQLLRSQEPCPCCSQAMADIEVEPKF